jgi:DNA-directed RNA polymerase subunit L
VPFLKKPWHPSVDCWCDEVDSIFSVIDRCERLDLSGGEPLLHTDISDMVLYLFTYIDRMGNGIRIITNGTVVPSDSLLDACKKFDEKIEFLVDNYGRSVSTRIEEICKALQSANIRYSVRNNDPDSPHCGGWVDLGIERGKRNSEHNAKALFSRCICNHELRYAGTIEAGRQYACKMSKLVTLAGWEDDDPLEYVDYMAEDKTIEQIRYSVEHLYDRDMLNACKYCNGFFESSPRFTPGVQLSDEEIMESMKF